MDKKKDYKQKHLLKTNGILYQFKDINDKVFEFVIYKGGVKKRFVCFVTFDDKVKAFVRTAGAKNRLKIKFMPKSTAYTSKQDGAVRWATSLIAESVEIYVNKTKTVFDTKDNSNVKLNPRWSVRVELNGVDKSINHNNKNTTQPDMFANEVDGNSNSSFNSSMPELPNTDSINKSGWKHRAFNNDY